MEKNIDAHDRDVRQTGHYVYTDLSIVSAIISTTTIQEHMAQIIRKYLPGNITILEIGCGDGTYTLDLARRVRPKKMVAIEPAASAVAYAKKNCAHKNISYRVGDAYTIRFKPQEFDLVLVRSVLHHLYNPQKALKNLCRFGTHVLIVEPNGYSPFLKIIEKVSKYHREHEERSFFPSTVHGWMQSLGFTLVEKRYINIVPTFAPKYVAYTLKIIEPIFEAVPFVKHLFCAQNVTLWRKHGM